MIAAIFVNYRCAERISEIVESIQPYNLFNIVVDNSGEYKPFSNEIVVMPRRNIGFGNAVNLGVDNLPLGVDYFYLINPDVVFDPTILVTFSKFVRERGAAVVSPLIFDSEGCLSISIFREEVTPWSEFKMVFPSYRKKLAKKASLSVDSCPNRLSYFNGCFVLIRKEVFLKAGGFPKEIFMYGEDTFLAFQIRQLGYRIELLKDCRVEHAGGKSYKGFIGRFRRLVNSSSGAANSISLMHAHSRVHKYLNFCLFLLVYIIRKLLSVKAAQ